jgi:hypothetical protein
MIHAELDPRKGLLIVTPEGPLTAEDFRGVAAIVDPYIAKRAVLRGLLVRAPTLSRLGELRRADRAYEVRAQPSPRHRTRRRRHRQRFPAHRARHRPAFLQPEIRVFSSKQEAEALAWLQTDT